MHADEKVIQGIFCRRSGATATSKTATEAELAAIMLLSETKRRPTIPRRGRQGGRQFAVKSLAVDILSR